MGDYYNAGYREAVLFLFYKKRHILVEHRPNGEERETFIPNGGIDTKDLVSNEDYKINAMKREISEEFASKIEIKKFTYLGEFAVEELKIKFFGYLVTDWIGIMPENTVENGEKFAELEWVKIEDYKKVIKFESAKFFIKKSLDLMKDTKFILNNF
ncbi:MAG: NUDIX domain-containing protein [archaeon]|jgi:8-oxo-dGTP pyrophosphatase MutT (NUDIX family)